MKERVIVSEKELQSYLDRGYTRSETGAETQLGVALWNLLPHEEREALVVVEIGAEAHTKLNAPPRRHGALLGGASFMSSAEVVPLDVLEDGFDSVLVARADADRAPERWDSSWVHDDPQGAARRAIGPVRDAITEHRMAIERLEAFLREWS